MKDQHTLIKGYRDLTQEEIALINEAKGYEATLRSFIEQKVKALTLDSRQARDVSLAITNLETGFIFLVRSIANPDGGLRDIKR